MNKHLLSLLILSIALMFSCTKETNEHSTLLNEGSSKGNNAQLDQVNTFKGPQVSVGNGKARSWIKIDHSDKPIEMGIEFTPDAFSGLPVVENEMDAHPHWDIPLHQKAKDVTAFDHVEINWNPKGHEPFFFEIPHFDFHFYLISESERLSIPEYTPGSAFDIYPPMNERPAGYVPTPGGIAAMGKHWSPPPPSFLPFTRVMIWGSYNGKMTFIEPMVTLGYLQSGETTHRSFGQPQVYPKPGNYPTMYNVYKSDNGHHIVSLSNFVSR